MQNVSIHKASELPQGAKSAVEQLLGRSIGADEEVSVAAVPPKQFPLSEDRAAIARKLEEFLNRRAEKTEYVSDQDIDGAIDEAVGHVRRSRK